MSRKRSVGEQATRSSARRTRADDGAQITGQSRDRRSRTKPRPRSMLEVISLGEEALPFLKENAVKGAQCVGAKDPLLVLDWNDAALAAATAHNRAFTKAAIEAVLQHPPSPLRRPTKVFGGFLYLYPEHEDLEGALDAVAKQLPWTRHGHPSHAAAGDVVRTCVELNMEKPARGVVVFKTQEHLAYYNL